MIPTATVGKAASSVAVGTDANRLAVNVKSGCCCHIIRLLNSRFHSEGPGLIAVFAQLRSTELDFVNMVCSCLKNRLQKGFELADVSQINVHTFGNRVVADQSVVMFVVGQVDMDIVG